MANLGEMVGIVQDIVSGQLLAESAEDYASSISKTSAGDIVEFLNRAVNLYATGAILPGMNVVTNPLPDLFTVGAITTGEDNYVSLPDNYCRGLQFVANASGVELTVFNNFGDLARTYPRGDDAGSVNAIAVKGTNLHYRRIPSSPEVLTIHYYRQPIDMADDTDEPDGIPIIVHESLLCNFAIMEVLKRTHNIKPDLLIFYDELLSRSIKNFDAILPTDQESVILT